MEVREMQKQLIELVDKIDAKLNFIHTDENSVMHLTEELGEISRQVLNPKMKREDFNIENLGEEIPILVNLESKTFKGLESKGMILAVDVKGKPVLLHPENEVPVGSIVK